MATGKRKPRINLKMLLGAVLIVGILAGGTAALWWFAVHRSPGRYEAQGDQAAQKGDYKEAIACYGRAMANTRRARNKVQVLLKTADAFSKMPVKTIFDAYFCFQNVLSLYEQVVELDPTQDKAMSRLLDYYYQLARDAGTTDSWDKLRAKAEIRLQKNPDDVQALKYYGIAKVVWMVRAPIDEKVRLQAREDIEKAQRAQPKDPELAFFSAFWCLNESRTQANEGDKARATELRDEARKSVTAFCARNPASLEGELNRIRILMEIGNSADDRAAKDEAMTLATALEKQLQSVDNSTVARELATFIRTTDREVKTLPSGKQVLRGMERATDILKGVLKRHPDQLEVLFELGALSRLTGNQDDAQAYYAKAAAERPAMVSPSVLRERNLQLMAEYELIMVLLAKRAPAGESKVRAGLLADAKKKFEDFKKTARMSPAIGFLEGKLAFEEGRPWEAVRQLDESNSKLDQKNPEASFLAGQILASAGENGVALKRLQAVFSGTEAQQEIRIKAAKEMAQILIRLRRFGDANAVMQSLVKAFPGDPEVILLMHQLLVEQGKLASVVKNADGASYLQEALNVLKPLLDKGDQEAERRMAELFMQTGNIRKAHEVLLSYTSKYPSDLYSFRNLIGLERTLGMNDIAARRVELALKSASANPAVELVRQALDPKSPFALYLEDLIVAALVKDDFAREINLYNIFRRMGKDDEALQALARAEKLNPENRSLLALRFERALQAKAWPQAAQIISRAAKSSTDTAEFRFWDAQVKLSREDYRGAISELSQALTERPLFSEGWTMLGTAHRLSGDLGTASSDFAKALELKPDSVPALRGMFLLYDAWQQYDKALENLRQIILYDPQNVELFTTYLSYMGRYGDKEEAVRIRKALLSMQPGNQDNTRELAQLYMQLNQAGEAEKLLDQLLKENPQNRASVAAMASLQLSLNHADAGRKVIEAYLAARGDKTTVEDWLLEARFLRQAGSADAARAAYDKAVALQDPKTMAVTIELGDWLAQRNVLPEALALFRQVRDKTKSPQMWSTIIDLLLRQKQLEEAEKELVAWQKAEPANGRQVAGEAMILMQRGKRSEAARVLTAAIRDEPQNPNLYLLRAQLQFNEGADAVQAVVKKDLEKTIEINPAQYQAREMLAEWFLNQRRWSEAGDEYTRLVELRPDVLNYRVHRAQLLLNQEKYDELERLLDDSMERLPGLPVWHQIRATLRRAQGQQVAAIQELGKAYELNPSENNVLVYADALLSSNKSQQALDVLNKWPQFAEKSAVLRAIHGRALAGVNKGFSAQDDFDKALDLAAADFGQMEEVLGQIGKVSTPAEMLTTLTARQNKNRTDIGQLAIAKIHLSQDAYTKGISLLEELRARLPQENTLMPSVLWFLASGYYQTKEFLKARGAYENLLRLQPNHGPALNNLSYLLAEDLKKPTEALPLAEKAATFWQVNEAERANVLDTLGRVQFLAGKIIEADLTLQRSIQLKDLPVNHYHMAEVMVARNRLADARSELQKARQLAEAAKSKDLMDKIDRLEATILEKSGGRKKAPTPEAMPKEPGTEHLLTPNPNAAKPIEVPKF